jgi:hypothetical protein
MERITSFAQLVAHVRANTLEATIHDEARAIEIRGDLPDPMLVRWLPERPFIQLIQPMLKDILGDRLRDLEHAIARTNLELEVPVFELSHRTRMLHARIAVAAFPGDGVLPATFEGLRLGCIRFARDYLPAFNR